jgi:hypothetical protein
MTFPISLSQLFISAKTAPTPAVDDSQLVSRARLVSYKFDTLKPASHAFHVDATLPGALAPFTITPTWCANEPMAKWRWEATLGHVQQSHPDWGDFPDGWT